MVFSAAVLQKKSSKHSQKASLYPLITHQIISSDSFKINFIIMRFTDSIIHAPSLSKHWRD